MVCPCGIDRSIEVSLLAVHIDVGFIQGRLSFGRLEMPTAALVPFRATHLDPTPNAARADGQIAISLICATESVYRRYPRTHHRMMSPG
jgi:hypothetical protein